MTEDIYIVRKMDKKLAHQVDMGISMIEDQIADLKKQVEYLEDSRNILEDCLIRREYRQSTLNLYLYPNVKMGKDKQ